MRSVLRNEFNVLPVEEYNWINALLMNYLSANEIHDCQSLNI